MSNQTPVRHEVTRRKSAEAHVSSVYNRECPTRVVLDRLADKWTVLVIGQLAAGTMRFAELRRAVDGISQKMLTSTLRLSKASTLCQRAAQGGVLPHSFRRLADQ
jgi:DNA-binding HxlR family transcriptional regulator